MNPLVRLLPVLMIGAVLSACTDTKTAIVGRWESPTWMYSNQPAFAQFSADGAVQHRTAFGIFNSTWVFLDSGELQITYPNGSSARCKASISGKTLTLAPPACLAWDEIPGSVELTQQ